MGEGVGAWASSGALFALGRRLLVVAAVASLLGLVDAGLFAALAAAIEPSTCRLTDVAEAFSCVLAVALEIFVEAGTSAAATALGVTLGVVLLRVGAVAEAAVELLVAAVGVARSFRAVLLAEG